MKRLIALLLALVMVLPMASCGQSAPPPSSATPAPSAAPASSASEADESAETKMSDIYEPDFSPADSNGNIIRNNRGAKGENGAVTSI